jgi:peptide/nickel transport system permease protein
MSYTAAYVTGKVTIGLATLFVVSALVFVALHFVPGSYTDVVVNPQASDLARDNAARQYGLDKPLVVQFVLWLKQLLSGNLGVMMGTGQPISELLGKRLPVTGELGLLATAFAALVGVPSAIAAGMAKSTIACGSSRLIGAVAMSTPEFVLGSVLVYFFSRYSLGLPAGGYTPFPVDPIANLRSMVLPVLTLGLLGVAMVIRTGRDAIASTLSLPHVTAAVARGESTLRIIWHHVLRNAAIPIATVLATFVGSVLGGAVIVENLFSVPGMGQAVLNGISRRDYAVVQGAVLVAAAAFIAVNMVADLAYGLIDPRVRMRPRA